MNILDDLNVAGIYFIKNRENGCVYIGCSGNVAHRIQTHQSDLRRGDHPNRAMQLDSNLYGIAAFDVGIIQELPEGVNGFPIEQAFIRAFRDDNPDLIYNNSRPTITMRKAHTALEMLSHLTWLELAA